MSRKKKNKIVKLTDKQYGDYVDAIINERPIKPLTENLSEK